MSDSSDPIKEVRKPYFITIDKNQIEYTFELAPNEFNNYDDSLGLFQLPPKSLNFLTVEKEKYKIQDSSKLAQATI